MSDDPDAADRGTMDGDYFALIVDGKLRQIPSELVTIVLDESGSVVGYLYARPYPLGSMMLLPSEVLRMPLPENVDKYSRR